MNLRMEEYVKIPVIARVIKRERAFIRLLLRIGVVKISMAL